MNIRKKLAAVLLSLCMLTAAAMPGFATDTSSSSSGSNGGTIYVSSYTADYATDTLIYTDGNKTQQAYAKEVRLNVVDDRFVSEKDLADLGIDAGKISVQINGRNFVLSTGKNDSGEKLSGLPQIENIEYTKAKYEEVTEKNSAGETEKKEYVLKSNGVLTYTIILPQLLYNGSGDKTSDDNTLQLDVSYGFAEGKNLPLATIEQKLSRFGTQTVTTPESTPEPTATPTPEPTPTPDPTYRTPSLIIRSTSIGGATVDAGDDFTLSLEVYATSSGTEPLCDVLVAISPADGVTLASGSTTRYIGDMDAGTSQTVTYKMHAQNSFTGGTSSVSVSLSANGKTTGAGAQATGTTVTVPVIQPERFEISNLEIPESITVGEENYASVTFVNKGKNELSNMTVTTTGSNLQEAEQNTFVGNVTAGSEQSVDINLCALEAGEVEGTISFVYEDSSGQEVTVTRNFSCTAEDAAMWDSDYIDSDYSDMNQETNTGSTGLPVWAWLLIAAVIAALCVAGVRVAKKHRSAGNLEEDNADF